MTKFLRAALAALTLAATLPAVAEVVVVVNPANSEAVSKDQVASVFLGKSTAFTPIDQADGSAIRGEFYKKVADKDAAQAKALWSKLVFTGKATPPKEVGSSADVKKAIAANPKGIGYIEKSAVDATVKVVLTP
jgi:ABC-type phosphate transport system substrate-binding protein